MPNWVSKPSAVLPIGQAMTPALAMTRSNGSPSATSASAQARTLASDARSSSTSSSPPPFAASARTCLGRRSRLVEIARRADDLRAVRGQRAGRLDAESGRHAGHQNALAGQVHALEHFVGRRCRAKVFAMIVSLSRTDVRLL